MLSDTIQIPAFPSFSISLTSSFWYLLLPTVSPLRNFFLTHPFTVVTGGQISCLRPLICFAAGPICWRIHSLASWRGPALGSKMKGGSIVGPTHPFYGVWFDLNRFNFVTFLFDCRLIKRQRKSEWPQQNTFLESTGVNSCLLRTWGGGSDFCFLYF